MSFLDMEKIHNKTLVFKEYLKKNNPETFFIYPLNQMIKEKSSFPTPLYLKGDIHPSGWGYFVLLDSGMVPVGISFCGDVGLVCL